MGGKAQLKVLRLFCGWQGRRPEGAFRCQASLSQGTTYRLGSLPRTGTPFLLYVAFEVCARRRRPSSPICQLHIAVVFMYRGSTT